MSPLPLECAHASVFERLRDRKKGCVVSEDANEGAATTALTCGEVKRWLGSRRRAEQIATKADVRVLVTLNGGEACPIRCMHSPEIFERFRGLQHAHSIREVDRTEIRCQIRNTRGADRPSKKSRFATS